MAMRFTAVSIISEEPLTFGAEHLPLDGAEDVEWKKRVQAVHPRLLPQLKDSALIEEEESEFCVAGGVFEYVRGQELTLDGEQLRLSHCAEHFLDILLSSEQCLQIIEENAGELKNLNMEKEHTESWATLCSWWERGWRVLLLQH
jgi:hypothetical protein